MISLEELKEKIRPALDENQVHLYEMKWVSQGTEKILQIAVMKDDGGLDLNTCADTSESISAILDADERMDESYTLEVCSPGAEREIKDLSELDRIKDAYVYIRLAHPIRKSLEFTGTVTGRENGILKLEYRDKAVKRVIEIEEPEIELIRFAVKF